MTEYNYISDKFLHNGHFWKATDEDCRCGAGYVVLRRTGSQTDIENLEPNVGIKEKICVTKDKVQKHLY